jgi:hypothetical protein
MAAKKKNVEGFAFLINALEKDKNAVYADVKAAAEKKGLVVHPIMFGRAKLKLGYVKAGAGKAKKAAKARAGRAKNGTAGRPVDGSSKSGQVRALLSSGMSPAEIAKKVGCTVGLVYNVKSTGGKVKRGPGRPPKAADGSARRGPGRPRQAASNLDGLGAILDAVKSSQHDLGRFRGALEKIQDVIVGVLS